MDPFLYPFSLYPITFDPDLAKVNLSNGPEVKQYTVSVTSGEHDFICLPLVVKSTKLILDDSPSSDCILIGCEISLKSLKNSNRQQDEI